MFVCVRGLVGDLARADAGEVGCSALLYSQVGLWPCCVFASGRMGPAGWYARGSVKYDMSNWGVVNIEEAGRQARQASRWWSVCVCRSALCDWFTGCWR